MKMTQNRLFITGIGTGIGKTLVSAIVTEALNADYWKPVQAGSLEFTDSDFVKANITNKKSVIHPEAYILKTPMSPHAAAEIEGVDLQLKNIIAPATKNTLIIEGAGCLLSPFNNQHQMADLITHLEAQAILVSQNYLGSINHTLLTYNELLRRNIKIAGIVFNGEKNESTQNLILEITGLNPLMHILPEKTISPEIITKYSKIFNTDF
jgi:dethiobiotin synthetase